MLVDNRTVVKAKNKLLYERLHNLPEQSSLEVMASKSGAKTLVIHQNNQIISYHSRYNPVKEAETFVSSQVDEDTRYVLFIGVGLGYNVQALVEHYPDVQFSVFEPNLEMMQVFLENTNLSKVKAQQLDHVFHNVDELVNIEEFFDKLEDSAVKIIIQPITEKYFKAEIDHLLGLLKTYLETKKSTALSNLKFQTRWTINAIANLGEVAQSPNIFIDVDQEKLAGQPVLIVSAGPSLNEEIERIRQIKKQGLAYIFAVGSTVNVLLNNDITPDALFLYDPLPFTANVVKKIKEMNLDIPLIFGSPVAYEVLADYPGKKIHFITEQDSVSSKLIDRPSQVIVPDASTIAAVVLYVVGKLQMGPIIYVGQNLSITKEKAYAEGTGHYDTAVNEQLLAGYEQVMSTTNETIYTHDGYRDMAKAITLNIARLGLQGSVFNTTQNGLPIEATTFMSLQDVMVTHLTTPHIVDRAIFDIASSYEPMQMMEGYKHLEQQFDVLMKDYKKLLVKVEEIVQAYDKKIVTSIPKLLREYDVALKKVEHNVFFEQVIAPITRLQYQEFVKDSGKVGEERLPLKRVKIFLAIHQKYIRTVHVAINAIQPAFAELKKHALFKSN